MQWRAHVTSIGLVVVTAGALAYAYADRGSVTVAEKKTREGSVFIAWRREDLTRIAIEQGASKLILERVKDDAGEPEWWMRAPLVERGDADACDKLVAALEFASVVRKVDPGVTAPGLDAPRARGEIVMGSVTHRFSLGGDAPTPSGAAYLRVDGAETVVVSRELVTALLQGADAYRSRMLVPYVSVELARLDLKRPDGAVALVRADDVSFKLAPSGLRGSRVKLDEVWGALAEMRAESFLEGSVAEALVRSPRATLTMTPIAHDRAPGVVLVGDACPGKPDDVAVVRESPTRLSVCAPKGILSGLATTEGELEDTHLFAAHDDEVAELRLESLPAGPALELARKESGWREKAPESRDLAEEEGEAAAALVSAIAHAEGADPRKSDEPFDARGRVTLHRADGDVAEVVEIGAPDASGDVVVRRLFDGARLHVAAAIARKLAARAVALRGHEPWTPRIEGVHVAAVETRCDGVAQRVTHDGDAWTMRAPGGFTPDNASILDLLDAVTRVHAQSWVADADDGHFGFGASPCFLALTLRSDGGERVARIELGRDGEGGTYARTGDSPAVFVAPKTLRDRASGWLVDLHGFAPANPESVLLERDGKRLSFESDAGSDQAVAVLDAANVLRADSVVHLGAALPDEGFSRPSLTVTLRAGDVSRHIVFGRELTGEEGRAKTLYARVGGVEATFAVDRDRVKALLDRF